jgi:hypothetical protein
LGLLQVIIAENLYNRGFVDKWCHGFDVLAAQIAAYTPARVEQMTGLPSAMIMETARLYATRAPAALITAGGLPDRGKQFPYPPGACAPAGDHRQRGQHRRILLAERPDYIPEIKLELSDRPCPKASVKNSWGRPLEASVLPGL